MKKLLFIILVLLISDVAEARIYIRIDEIAEKKFPIAITQLVNAGQKRDSRDWSRQISQILRNDLRMSGLFEFVEAELFPGEDADKFKSGDVNFGAWKLLGVQGLVKGGFTYQEDGKVHAQLYLYDPLLGQQLIGHEYKASPKQFRKVAHHFADMILEALTGYPGIFRTRIAFVCHASSAKEICSMGVDGKGVARHTNDRNINISPDWSPAGGKLVYTSFTEDGDAQLKILNLGAKSAKQITKGNGVNLSPTWTPNGRFITAFTGDTGDDIVNFALNGKVVKKLTRHWSIDIGPSWAPDGSAFVFSSERAGGLHVFRADAGGGNVQRLTFVGYQNDNPAWSPDGQKIVFQGRDEGVWDLFIMNPDGSLLQRLTAGSGHNQEPTWAPNGQYIGFASSRAGGFNIYMMTSIGENQTRIGPGTMPDWGPLPKKGF